jgi:hypothetical protein
VFTYSSKFLSLHTINSLPLLQGPPGTRTAAALVHLVLPDECCSDCNSPLFGRRRQQWKESLSSISATFLSSISGTKNGFYFFQNKPKKKVWVNFKKYYNKTNRRSFSYFLTFSSFYAVTWWKKKAFGASLRRGLKRVDLEEGYLQLCQTSF